MSVSDEQLLQWARARIDKDAEILQRCGASGELKIDVARGTVLITDPSARRTRVASMTVLDSDELEAHELSMN
jgi:hypothetical protein